MAEKQNGAAKGKATVPPNKPNKVEKKVPRKAATMELKGNDYAKVPTRVLEFHKANKNGNIQTEYKIEGDKLFFIATITPDTKNPERKFTGHALGKLTGDKQFEKIETVAVGRALAFAGFLASGEIASAEEMTIWEEEKSADDEKIKKAMNMIESATTVQALESLKNRFQSGKILSDAQKAELAEAIAEKVRTLTDGVDTPPADEKTVDDESGQGAA